MPIKTTGAEFKAFYTDERYWPEGTYHDDDVIKINGEHDEGGVVVIDVADDAAVVIESGYVLDKDGEDLGSLVNYFKKWRREQSAAVLVVDCDMANLEAVKTAIQAAGGRVR